VDTIRAFGQVSRFEETYRHHLDQQMVPYFFARTVLFAWMTIRINIISSIVVCTIMLVVVIFPDLLPPGNVALALTFGISVTDMMLHIVNLSIEAEIQMNAVERIKFYAEELPQEKPMLIKETEPSSEWPLEGAIKFDSVVAGYREGPDVLKSISFDIRPSEKIGIVGRTGSGKSSLLVLLFRIIEPRSGRVIIDGIDTSVLGLQHLRRNLGIIPQTPVMFSGTLRKNVDPFEEHTDERLWEVLMMCGLKDMVTGLPVSDGSDKLEYLVTEGGTNFSVGQRQLLCMARALLLDPKILLLDEATAQIDQVTDAMLQRMIRENFKEKTVLTIAHRLETIMDSDRILVLDDGHLAEFASPSELLKDETESGLFRLLVHAEGEENAEKRERKSKK
jgi:ABC-type multidrug transport system fused ATPase/permease subunit